MIIKNAGFNQSNHSSLTISMQQYTKLKEQIKKVKYPTYAFSQAQRLEQKINSFKSQKIRQQLKQQLGTLNSYRKVRGDGNCFFRALAFAYISGIEQPTFNNCFQILKQINLTCCYQQSIPKQFRKFYDHKFLTNVLEMNWQATYNYYLKQTANIQKKALIKLFDECPYLDFILILYFRAVCLKAFCKYYQEYQNFIVGGQQRSIRTYSEQTQGIAINLCSKILNVTIIVIEVRKQEINSYNYDVSKTRRDPPTICLLFNQNHYDIIQYNDNIQAERSTLKKKQTYYEQVSQKLVIGTCVQCRTNGYVNQVSRLCLKCHQYSLTSLQNFKKQKFVHGKCNQCSYIKDNISTTFGICQGCADMLNQAEQMKRMEALKPKMKRCASCNRLSTVDEQTFLCEQCLNQQRNAFINLESTRKQNQQQIQKQQQRQQQQKYNIQKQQNPTEQMASQFDIKKPILRIPASQIKAQSKIRDPQKNFDNFTCKKCTKMFLAGGLLDGLCRTCLKR